MKLTKARLTQLTEVLPTATEQIARDLNLTPSRLHVLIEEGKIETGQVRSPALRQMIVQHLTPQA